MSAEFLYQTATKVEDEKGVASVGNAEPVEKVEPGGIPIAWRLGQRLALHESIGEPGRQGSDIGVGPHPTDPCHGCLDTWNLWDVAIVEKRQIVLIHSLVQDVTHHHSMPAAGSNRPLDPSKT